MSQYNNGFMQIIVILILIVIIVSLLGISLKDIFGKLSANPEVKDNFTFIKNWMIDLYKTYLSKPIGNSLDYAKNYLLSSFLNKQ